ACWFWSCVIDICFVTLRLSTITTSFPTRRSSALGHPVLARVAHRAERRAPGPARPAQFRAQARRCDPWKRAGQGHLGLVRVHVVDRKSTRLNSSHVKISYAVFCLKKKMK